MTPQPLTCSADQYQCAYAHQCIPRSWRCDGEPDCVDKSDEESCSSLLPGTVPPQDGCSVGQYRCLNALCLPSILRCDGVADCPDGEDENGCREFCLCRLKQTPGSVFTPCPDDEGKPMLSNLTFYPMQSIPIIIQYMCTTFCHYLPLVFFYNPDKTHIMKDTPQVLSSSCKRQSSYSTCRLLTF